MFLMIEKGIRSILCNSINRYIKLILNIWKIIKKIKNFVYFKYWDINDLYGWAMLQKLPGNGFNWAKNLSEFNEDLIKTSTEKRNEGHFLEMDVQYFEILNDPHNDKVKKLVANLRDKKGIYFKHSKSKASVKSPIGFEKKSENN